MARPRVTQPQRVVQEGVSQQEADRIVLRTHVRRVTEAAESELIQVIYLCADNDDILWRGRRKGC
jgi:beta-N-acetylglucosaminidase